ncbi:MAG TPA: gliding motility-associated C-terminal domain-containing protein [Saprospiraceae bacterium]|nr:gliding motility-associated C-terminal domain-containing protein [Saprospiraceae bacterium]
MKFFYAFLVFIAFSGFVTAQAPINDNCNGLIDLGVAPICPQTVYTNVNATATNIGFGNNPSCFNGGTAQRDVWFSFTTGDDILSFSIQVVGSVSGTNMAPITNPQIAVYRGDCALNGLAEISCISSPNGSNQTVLDILDLTPNTTYFLRINDYSATASPNWGDFNVCITEYVPAFNIGDAPGSTACFGTVYDSGGPDAGYGNNENHTFTICPADFHQCIEISVLDFNMENNLDRLVVFGGNSIAAPVLGTITGVNPVTQPFVIQASTNGCVTLQFISDGSVVGTGFELTWTCSPLECNGSSFDDPIVINNVPFSLTGATTCDDASNFNQSPCGNDAFLNGPEDVYVFNSPGGICVGIQITGANAGTGVLVLNGPPGDPATVCVAVSATGTINSADLREPGIYYIVVADGNGCTPYNISITPTECELPAGLVNALCNPLNGCIEEGGVPSVFNFQDGFQDIDLIEDVNSGCFPTNGVGAEADFYWFTIQAQADGPFGFILEGAGAASDIDFSVWGPFTQEQVCETPGVVINAVTNTQPIRSSWTGGSTRTGLADINPDTGAPVLDDFDCGSPATPGAGGDRFVRTIPALEGQVFVILTNDFGNQIGEEGISVDWSTSDPDVLAPPPPVVTGNDTTICIGASVQLSVISAIGNISWSDPTGTLSCTNCPNPVATPSATTTYTALIDAVCYDETIDVKVTVFDVDAGPNLTVCRGEQIQIVSGTDYENATYEWTAPAGVTFSCTDCPDPMVEGSVSGEYSVRVRLITPNCILSDSLRFNVLPQPAPQFAISDNVEICVGASVNLGGAATPDVTYSWSSVPGGFASGEANPQVSPTQTTTYYLSATNSLCPLSSLDSVTVTVYQTPSLTIPADTAVCQGQPILLTNTTAEQDVTYQWSGPDDIENPDAATTVAQPQNSGDYVLRATRGVCEVSDTFTVTITPIDLAILNPDTLRICLGETVDLQLNITPSNAVASWAPAIWLSSNTGNSIQATPETTITYFATVNVPGCSKTDRIVIEVDSLPADRAIIADPAKDPYCPGDIVILRSTNYEPSDFPDIEFQWLPGPGFETPDTLWNMVISAIDTATYRRVIIHRGCVDTVSITINVVEPPMPVVTPADTTICPGESVQLVATGYGEYEFSWEPTTGLSCTDCPNPVATPGATITYNFQVDVPNCPVGASATIRVVIPPVVNMSPNRTVCIGTPVQLNLAADNESLYRWTSSTDPNFTSNDPLLIAAPLVTTTYTLRASKAGCPDAVYTVTITVIQPPTADAGPDQTICQGSTATLAGTFGGAATSGIWTTASGGSFSPNAMTANAVYTPTTTGIITLRFTATDPNNVCPQATDEMALVVNPAATVNAGPDQAVCSGNPVTLAGTIGGGATSAVWTASVPGGVFNPNANTLNATYTAPAGVTSVTLTLRTNDPDGPCPAAEDQMVIAVTPPATVNAGQDFSVCRPVGFNLTAAGTAVGGVQSYSWSGPGITGSNNTASVSVSSSAALSSPAMYIVNYSYGPNANLICATVRDTILVTIEESVRIDALVSSRGDSSVVIGSAVTITANTTPGDPVGAMYLWSVNGGAEQMGGPAFTDTPIPATGVTSVNYRLIVKSAAGCLDTAFLDINLIIPDVMFPNVFTPNGDDLNDLFRPLPTQVSGVLIIEDFKIYNRWGQVVYNGKSNDNIGWNGVHNGSPAPIDVYVYRVKFRYPEGPVLEKSGDLTLIR